MTQLPIFDFKKEICSAVKNNQVVIITAETGAGKSTQVPQFLLEEDYSMIVTQPRRLAARTVSQRVADELGQKLGETVGYRTAMERVDSQNTKCLFCTDGLALVRELMGGERSKRDVLILDEVHEWNINIEVLVAWTKLQLSLGADFKVVLMSATLEADKLSEYFNDAPIISVPGRLHPIEKRKAGVSLESDTAGLLRGGRNVLVFQPGKPEIAKFISDLSTWNLNAEVLALHGDQTPEEQSKCFRHYGRPKCIVSTNVAQTSVTIDDIDAVADSGMEKRNEVHEGVEGLYLKAISLSDSKQREGRAGRTKSGIYIDHCKDSQRLEFPVAEIMRSLLDQTVLRLAEAGFDAERLDFFHQPDKSKIREAVRALHALGCMDKNGKVTEIGKRVARMPISVKFARMIIEGERLGVVEDVIKAAAILETGEITIRPKDKYSYPKWRRLTSEYESDVLAQIDVFNAAMNMSKEELQENDIHLKAFFRAKEIYRHLVQSLRNRINIFSNGNRESVMRAICAGMVDHLYHFNCGIYKNGDETARQLNRNSVIRGAEWLVGIPWDLEINGRYGLVTLNLVIMATKVNPMWLAEIAPQLVEIKKGIEPFFDSGIDSCCSLTEIRFNGQFLKSETEQSPEHEMAEDVFNNWLATAMALK